MARAGVMAALLLLLGALCVSLCPGPALALPAHHRPLPAQLQRLQQTQAQAQARGRQRLAVPQAKAKAKGKGKVMRKRHPGVRIPRPTVKCQTNPQNPPYRSTSCVVSSTASFPLCIKMRCNPNPAGPCPTNSVVRENRECAWAINQDCTSPAPVQPRSSWGWGMMTTGDSPVNIVVLNYTIVSGGSCPQQWN